MLQAVPQLNSNCGERFGWVNRYLRFVTIPQLNCHLRFYREERIKEMTVDNTFMIKKIQAMKTLFAIYSPLTKMPYIQCDEETFDDQVHLFTELENAKTFCEEKMKEKIPLLIHKLENEKIILQFYNELYLIGVNAVVYHDEVNATHMELDKIIKIHDWEDKKQKPVLNPLLQLTAAYFFQEARRPEQPKDDPQRNRLLHELEEEMLVNIGRSTLILPVIPKPVKEGEENQPPQLGAVVLKNNKNEVFQPVFTDFSEIIKMYPKDIQKFHAMAVPFSKLPAQVLENSQGMVLNPAGFNLILNRQLLQLISQRFVQTDGGSEKEKQ